VKERRERGKLKKQVREERVAGSEKGSGKIGISSLQAAHQME
jgi:hypothetical protein